MRGRSSTNSVKKNSPNAHFFLYTHIQTFILTPMNPTPPPSQLAPVMRAMAADHALRHPIRAHLMAPIWAALIALCDAIDHFIAQYRDAPPAPESQARELQAREPRQAPAHTPATATARSDSVRHAPPERPPELPPPPRILPRPRPSGRIATSRPHAPRAVSTPIPSPGHLARVPPSVFLFSGRHAQSPHHDSIVPIS